MNNSNILVVEDDAAIRSLITTALETENYKTANPLEDPTDNLC